MLKRAALLLRTIPSSGVRQPTAVQGAASALPTERSGWQCLPYIGSASAVLQTLRVCVPSAIHASRLPLAYCQRANEKKKNESGFSRRTYRLSWYFLVASMCAVAPVDEEDVCSEVFTEVDPSISLLRTNRASNTFCLTHWQILAVRKSQTIYPVGMPDSGWCVWSAYLCLQNTTVWRDVLLA